jgi:predicted permease
MDLGFRREGLLTMEIAPEHQLFGRPEWMAMQSQILDRVRALPGVLSASWSTMTPLSGRDRGVALDVPGFIPRNETDWNVHLVSVSPEYFATFGVPLRSGREFTAHDIVTAPKVAILNETAARFYFGGISPVGRKVKLARRPNGPVYEIVGVARDTKHAENLRVAPERFVFLPIQQSIDRINRLALTVRTAGDSMALSTPVRKEVLGVSSTLLIINVTTIDNQVRRVLVSERLVSSLSTAFGALALVLACIGLYGILGYAVTRRTGEIGIRMALGATSAGILWSILREALILAGVGIAIGIPADLALGRILKALLYGVQTFDVPTLAGAVLLLLVFAVMAGIVPARRASRLDPMAALRCE